MNTEAVTEEYALNRKKTFIQLGVSLALLNLRERLERVKKEQMVDSDDGTLVGEYVRLDDIEALLSSASVDAIMETCRVQEADGVEK